MKKIIIESPYAGDIKNNIEYARACVRDSLTRGESPMASHLLYTQSGILNDNDNQERKLGIMAGFEWLKIADYHVFYIDYGYSPGMIEAKKIGKKLGIKFIERKIYLPVTTKEEIIMHKVCAHFCITTAEIYKKTRKPRIVMARQIIHYLLSKYSVNSPSIIGKLTNRDRTTVIHSINTIEGYLTYDKSLKNIIQKISEDLGNE